MKTKFFGEINNNKFLKELEKVLNNKFATKKELSEIKDSINDIESQLSSI